MLQTTIIVLSILIFILFVVITIISGMQYSRYTIVDGTAICEESSNQCTLSFPYIDTYQHVKTKISTIAFSDIHQTGVFNVKVAFRPPTVSHDDVQEYFIVGSPHHIFLGTKSMLLIYILLTLLALFICISFIPQLYPTKIIQK